MFLPLGDVSITPTAGRLAAGFPSFSLPCAQCTDTESHNKKTSNMKLKYQNTRSSILQKNKIRGQSDRTILHVWLTSGFCFGLHSCPRFYSVSANQTQHNATQCTSLHLKFLTRKAKQVGARTHNTYRVYYNVNVKQKPLLQLWHETENKLYQKNKKQRRCPENRFL